MLDNVEIQSEFIQILLIYSHFTFNFLPSKQDLYFPLGLIVSKVGHIADAVAIYGRRSISSYHFENQ